VRSRELLASLTLNNVHSDIRIFSDWCSNLDSDDDHTWCTRARNTVSCVLELLFMSIEIAIMLSHYERYSLRESSDDSTSGRSIESECMLQSEWAEICGRIQTSLAQ
jgi:hypothetical protein